MPVQIADNAPWLTLSTGWPPSFGLGGRFRSESVVAFRRNRWPLCLGFRNPVSASNFDPLERLGLAVALVSSELAGIAETRRARVA